VSENQIILSRLSRFGTLELMPAFSLFLILENLASARSYTLDLG
jgi:hypothetical protein